MSMDQKGRSPSRQDVGSAKERESSRVAPGKVTRTSRLAPAQGGAIQRKATAAETSMPRSPAKTAWELTNDPWMDAAHRGVMATTGAPSLASSAVVQREENPAAMSEVAPTSTPADEGEATAQAREEITNFMAQTYFQQRYVTANGYGAFDLQYAPQASQCTVTVPIEFDFQNAPPSVVMKYLGLSTLDKLLECVWTDDKKEAFKRDMIAQVDRVWRPVTP
jgi:hypothetical protein